MQQQDISQAILTFLHQEQAHIEPVKTRRVADALGISVYAARYQLMRLHQQQRVQREQRMRGQSTRWFLLT